MLMGCGIQAYNSIMDSIEIDTVGNINWNGFLAEICRIENAEFALLSIDGDHGTLEEKKYCAGVYSRGENVRQVSVERHVNNKDISFFCMASGITLSIACEEKNNLLTPEYIYSLTLKLLLNLYCVSRKNSLLGEISEKFITQSILLDVNGKVFQDSNNIEPWITQGIFSVSSNELILQADKTWIKSSLRSVVRTGAASQFRCRSVVKGCHGTLIIKVTRLSGSDQAMSGWVEQCLFNLRISFIRDRFYFESVSRYFGLNDQHTSVIEQFSQGVSARDISDKTGYSQHSVYSYVKDVYSGFGIKHQSHLTSVLSRNLIAPVELHCGS